MNTVPVQTQELSAEISPKQWRLLIMDTPSVQTQELNAESSLIKWRSPKGHSECVDPRTQCRDLSKKNGDPSLRPQ